MPLYQGLIIVYMLNWYLDLDSNQEPTPYQDVALTTCAIKVLVGPRGFEPLTYGFEDRYDFHFTKDPYLVPRTRFELATRFFLLPFERSDSSNSSTGAYCLVVDQGYDPCRSSPSDQSPGIIRPRRTPVLSTIGGKYWSRTNPPIAE